MRITTSSTDPISPPGMGAPASTLQAAPLVPVSPHATDHFERACGARGCAPAAPGRPVEDAQLARELLDAGQVGKGERERLSAALAHLERDYRAWRAEHPEEREPSDGTRKLSELIDDPSLSDEELCARLIAVLCHEEPSLPAQLQAAVSAGTTDPAGGGAPSPAEAPPNTEASRALFGAVGMGASTLGGLLQNPLAVTVLTGVCALVPGLEPLALVVPIAAPIAGLVLSGAGGMASQVAQGQPPTLALGAPGAAGGADPLQGLLGGIAGAIAGAPGASAPVLPVPAR